MLNLSIRPAPYPRLFRWRALCLRNDAQRHPSVPDLLLSQNGLISASHLSTDNSCCPGKLNKYKHSHLYSVE